MINPPLPYTWKEGLVKLQHAPQQCKLGTYSTKRAGNYLTNNTHDLTIAKSNITASPDNIHTLTMQLTTPGYHTWSLLLWNVPCTCTHAPKRVQNDITCTWAKWQQAAHCAGLLQGTWVQHKQPSDVHNCYGTWELLMHVLNSGHCSYKSEKHFLFIKMTKYFAQITYM